MDSLEPASSMPSSMPSSASPGKNVTFYPKIGYFLFKNLKIIYLTFRVLSFLNPNLNSNCSNAMFLIKSAKPPRTS